MLQKSIIKNSFSLAICLALSYSLCAASDSEPGNNEDVTRRPYMYSDGSTGRLTTNAGARYLLGRYPQLFAALMNSMEEEIAHHEPAGDHNSSENSARTSEMTQPRAQPTHRCNHYLLGQHY